MLPPETLAARLQGGASARRPPAPWTPSRVSRPLWWVNPPRAGGPGGRSSTRTARRRRGPARARASSGRTLRTRSTCRLPCPFEGAYAGDPSDDPPAWGAYVFDGVQNALRAELVALRQAVSGSRDAAPMVAFTDCQFSSTDGGEVFWRLPHTMTHHHEHDLVKGVVDAVLAPTHPVHLVKVRAHTGLHGNEVADSVAKWATESSVEDPPEGSERASGTAPADPAGVGIVCPWDAVPDALRATAPPTGMREGGGPFHAYSARATLAGQAAAAYERLLVGGPSKGVATG